MEIINQRNNFNNNIEKMGVNNSPLFSRIFGDNDGIWYSVSFLIGVLDISMTKFLYSIFLTWETVFNFENDDNKEVILKSLISFILGLMFRMGNN